MPENNSSPENPGFIAGYLEQHPEHEAIMRAVLSGSESGTRSVDQWKQARRRAA